MDLHVTNESGEEIAPFMGSYGIGIERILSAAVELYHDADGIALPAVDRAVYRGRHAGEHQGRRAAPGRRRRFTTTLKKAGVDVAVSTIATSARA